MIRGTKYLQWWSVCRTRYIKRVPAINQLLPRPNSLGCSSAPHRCFHSSEDDIVRDESLYLKQREKEIHSLTSQPYPDSFKRTMTLAHFVAKYQDIEAGARLTSDTLRVTGRILSKREASRKLTFYHIGDGTGRVQLLSSQEQYGGSTAQFEKVNQVLQRGDVVGVEGFPGKSQKGELSVIPTTLQLLAPCMRPLPLKLHNPETRYSQRYLDLLVNKATVDTVHIRSRILKLLRHFFDRAGFLEVETPLLQRTAGGAAARPFSTMQAAGNVPLYLRIAPELYLKQLIIGVFELGKQFRNEGVDRTHNPEFTSLEAYAAYHDYEDLMVLTEELIAFMWSEVLGELVMTIGEQRFPLDRPFPRLRFVETIEREAGAALPALDDAAALLRFAQQHQVSVHPPHTPARLLDQIAGRFGTALLLHPQSSLYPHPDRPELVQRFELFIGGTEYCNAYTELNDPRQQRHNFEEQQAARLAGDLEAQSPDLDFCTALEYGLPPTAGWGMGVDRLVMLLAKQPSIRDVLLFPLVKTKVE